MIELDPPKIQELIAPQVQQPTPNQVHDPIEEERKLSFYRQALLKNLDPAIFKPNPWRLGFMAVFVFVSCAMVYLIAFAGMIWPVKLLCGLVLGVCTGNIAFIGHELLHGSIIRSQRMQDLLFLFGVAPFFLSPTYWRYSHNRLHHGHSQQLITDPDAFPNLRIFKLSRFMKFMFPYTPGSGHKRSLLYFFFWFSFHNLTAQVWMRFRNRGFDQMNHKRVNWELGFQLVLGAAYLWIIGPSNWVWGFIVPTMMQNYWLMSYIATNHNLSPLTNVNDPLVNSLTVTNHPILEFLSLNFGYHVEHHIFPHVNGKHSKVVHRQLLKQYSSIYKIMPKHKAMRALYKTPRIYKNSRQLVHPRTGALHPTL